MHCISCNLEVSSKMKAALYSNVCPFCGSAVLEPHKAKSYADLIAVLDKVRLTNRDDVDVQIKEKLMDVLVKHFNFSKLDSSKTDEDVVAVDDTIATSSDSLEESLLDDIPTRSMSKESPTPPRKLKSQKLNPSARMYAEAAEATYGLESDSEDLLDEEDSDEFSQYFTQSSLDTELASKVDKYKKLHQDRTARSSDSNSRGIKRL